MRKFQDIPICPNTGLICPHPKLCGLTARRRNRPTLRAVICALFAITLAACTQPKYYQEGATQAQGNRDAYECLTIATALGGAYYIGSTVERFADQTIYHRCLVARGWRLRGA